MKQKIFLVSAIVVSFSLTSQAQTKDGGISQQMLKEIQQAQTSSVADKALFNAMASNKIDDLAQNFSKKTERDTYFSVETPKQSITNQRSSGRCWMFSGFNVLRANFAAQCANDPEMKDFGGLELSQNYLFFWDQLEKANLFLQGVIDCGDKPMEDTRVRFFFKSPLGDGGTFCGVSDLVEKYGLAPAEVVPETFSAENTSKFNQLLKSKLREQGLRLREMVNSGKNKAAIRKEKQEMLGVVYHMLSMAYGAPVKEFTYAFKDKNGKVIGEPQKYTPLTFAKRIGADKLNGSFIMVMNDPRRPYHKTYEVDFDRHTYDGHNWVYLNLPMDEIEALAIASLKDGRKLYSSYDVNKQSDRKVGYNDLNNFDYETLFVTTFPMNKAERIATFDSGSTHAMTLCAVDLTADGKAKKWKVENSWGYDAGQKGYLIMTDEWFREYMFRLVVNKKYVPEALLKEAAQKPVMVMPEDPLFVADE